ncbi:diketogulonate reductase-like aldo/keto reductase [Herbihabitans rhizosphaerae]|uniref:Diketogulonate reductase-like aldo/keto reductase n=1 Tax=Herbihabitans rhizosphaerae TaxID=1872711 RepID=A0A4Q7L8F3_9PSEU|nr:aldo/keto reductase [Herbihabitans rhizosphaerae]RZS45210.1 diketogulonate reductase-like aldo/keto reductase [Herbihabitans rhizosphaerae]
MTLGTLAGQWNLGGERSVGRMGFGAMSLPKWPRDTAIAVPHRAVELGVNHVDTASFYARDGVSANELIRAALHPSDRFATLAGLREEGLIEHLGISNVTPSAVARAQRIAPVTAVQNHYNLVHRDDAEVAARHDATPTQVALALTLRRSPSILLIPGTGSAAHLEENMAVLEF